MAQRAQLGRAGHLNEAASETLGASEIARIKSDVGKGNGNRDGAGLLQLQRYLVDSRLVVAANARSARMAKA